ncbi:MAG TPA: hypothetical protein DEP42_07270 [Ruminococcaceae bacterium]|nr:hypothetical protein [Oscillospiraceae bacterium]
MHTTQSDGKIPGKEAARIYKDAGYDFIALTDHLLQSETIEAADFLQLAGCELDTGSERNPVQEPVYHIIGVGMTKKMEFEHSKKSHPQEMIDAIRDAGGYAILAHPFWSLTDPAAVCTLKGLSAAEIYNTFSGMPWNARPESSFYFDLWAQKGLLMPVTAADDSHLYDGEQTRAYMMVNSSSLSAKDICTAIGAGNFYASQGPRFENISLSSFGGTQSIEVTCSAVEKIIFYSDTIYCNDRVAVSKGDRTLISAKYTVKQTDHFVRIELIDRAGRHAWSSPFGVGDDD